MPMQQSRLMDVVLPVLTIKNTFIDFVDQEDELEQEQPRPRRRCSSLPPQAKLASEGAATPASDADASTASWRSSGSESPRMSPSPTSSSPRQRWSELDEDLDRPGSSSSSCRCESPEPWSGGLCGSDAGSDTSGSLWAARAAAQAADSRVTLRLEDQIAPDAVVPPVPVPPVDRVRTPLGGGRTPLKSGSRMFTPQAAARTPALPPGVRNVLSAAQAALARDPTVCSAELSEGAMGDTAEITAEVLACAPVSDERLLTCAKTALLEAAGHPQLVYVLGYGRRPFQDLGEGRFGCTLARVPAEGQHLMCFDTCQQGFCSRPTTCRWRHPDSTDLLKVVVTIRRVHAR